MDSHETEITAVLKAQYQEIITTRKTGGLL